MRRLLLLLTILLMLAWTPEAWASYAHKIRLTIPYSQVPNSDQTGFPVLVSLTNAAWKTVASGGHVTSSSGYDLIFTSDEAGTTQLPHEIDKYDGTNGTIVMWVKLNLSHTTNTVFWVQYGDSGVTTSQENKSSLWSGYTVVYHLGDGSTLGTGTSIGSNNLSVTGSVPAATGKISGGASFSNNTANYMLSGSNVGISGTGTRTLSMWAQSTTASGFHVAGGFGTNFTNQDFQIAFNGQWLLQLWGATDWNTGVNANTNMNYHVVTYDGTDVRWYVNGTLLSGAAHTVALATSNNLMRIGVRPDGNYGWSGTIDEIRLTTSVLTADWVTTEYNNQNAPSTFVQVSAEDPSSATTTRVRSNMY